MPPLSLKPTEQSPASVSRSCTVAPGTDSGLRYEAICTHACRYCYPWSCAFMRYLPIILLSDRQMSHNK